MTPTILQKASEFVAGTDAAAIPAAVLAEGRKALVDYAGCAVAGSREPAALAALRWASARGVGTATVIGHAARLDPARAAFCNATSGHALDFDDCSTTSLGHPTTVCGPAVLALGEVRGSTGAEVLQALCIGIETGHKLAALTNPEVSRRGWHATSVFGVPIAAAAAAVLLRCDAATTCNALGLALSRAGGLRSNFGTMTKPLHAGLAAMDGLECAGMARAGLTAAPDAFEKTDGFVSCFAGGALHQPETVAFGRDWDMEKVGLWFKPYPCCSGSHAAVDVLSEALAAGRLRPEDVRSIHVGCSLMAPRELVRNFPTNALEARFSMQYALAARLIYGELTIDQYTDAMVTDPRIRALMRNISMETDPDFAKRGFIADSPVIMRITRTDGGVLELRRDGPRGLPPRRLPLDDIRAKFHRTAGRYLPPTAVDELLDRLAHIDREPDLLALMRLLRITAA